jgi:hypothetical protein
VAINRDIWTGAILGAILGALLGSIIIPLIRCALARMLYWWISRRPVNRLLGLVIHRNEPCKIFLRGFFIAQDTPLFSIVRGVGIGQVPNIHELWADVEGRAVANVLNVLGRAGKSHNINIVREADDAGEWNSHLIVIGAQYPKASNFFKLMTDVTYSIDDANIIDNVTKRAVPREDGYGYGIIIKSRNPLYARGGGVAFLIAGYGTLGTVAASYYFREHYQSLGRQFRSDCFGVVVRAPLTAGEQAVERLFDWDRRLPA